MLPCPAKRRRGAGSPAARLYLLARLVRPCWSRATEPAGAGVAQSVEQLICNQQVVGSNPIASFSSNRRRAEDCAGSCAPGEKDGAGEGRERRRRGVCHRGIETRLPAERYPSGQRGQTVNLLAYAYGGSNPPLSTHLERKAVCGRIGTRRPEHRNERNERNDGTRGTCGSSSGVEHQPSKLRVAGSRPVSRSRRDEPYGEQGDARERQQAFPTPR